MRMEIWPYIGVDCGLAGMVADVADVAILAVFWYFGRIEVREGTDEGGRDRGVDQYLDQFDDRLRMLYVAVVID